jgi:hypothetical protein
MKRKMEKKYSLRPRKHVTTGYVAAKVVYV